MFVLPQAEYLTFLMNKGHQMDAYNTGLQRQAESPHSILMEPTQII